MNIEDIFNLPGDFYKRLPHSFSGQAASPPRVVWFLCRGWLPAAGRGCFCLLSKSFRPWSASVQGRWEEACVFSLAVLGFGDQAKRKRKTQLLHLPLWWLRELLDDFNLLFRIYKMWAGAASGIVCVCVCVCVCEKPSAQWALCKMLVTPPLF